MSVLVFESVDEIQHEWHQQYDKLDTIEGHLSMHMHCSKSMITSGFKVQILPLFVYFESHSVSFWPDLVVIQHTLAL